MTDLLLKIGMTMTMGGAVVLLAALVSDLWGGQ